MGTPLSPPPKGSEAPNFSAHLLWPNGWMNQDDTWHGARPQPRQLCVRRGTQPLPKRGGAPNFRPMSTAAKRVYMDQDATWYGGRPRLRRHCVTWGPSSHSPLKVYCGQAGWQVASRCHLVWGRLHRLSPGNFVVDGDPAAPPKKGWSPQFSAHV